MSLSKKEKIFRAFSFIVSIPMLFIIRFWQRALSPFLGSNCRFYPSCSEYAYLAIKRHGPVRGFLLGFMRVLRCHSLSKGGMDPVPEAGALRHKHEFREGPVAKLGNRYIRIKISGPAIGNFCDSPKKRE